MKIEVFEEELNYIKNKRILDNAKTLINNLPDYFFEVGATSSGKYHPDYALGEGGLVRHTKAAVYFLKTFLNHPLVDYFTSDEEDLLVLALLLHDGYKREDNLESTVFDHPMIATNKILEVREDLTLTDEELKIVIEVIGSHMGPWNISKDSKTVLEIPKNKYQLVVHFSDYFASRKEIEIKFDEETNFIVRKK